MSVIIAGIHTGIGKTICSAVICQAAGYDYWKPVQAGALEDSDSIIVNKLVTNPLCSIHPEAYLLQIAASPHYAAGIENIEIKRESIVLPASSNNIVVETAGGIMSPLAKNFLNIDLIQHLKLPVVLVAANYLGSINHTLLSFYALQKSNVETLGIVFSGAVTTSSQQFILDQTQLNLLFSIPLFEEVTPEAIKKFANSTSLNF